MTRPCRKLTYCAVRQTKPSLETYLSCYLKSMERSYDSVLRTARGHVIPQVPELAPELRSDSRVLLTAVKTEVEKQDTDPKLIPWVDYNRAERETISGFLINEQAHFLVEGTGADARFRPEALKESRSEGRPASYEQELKLLLSAGARYVKHAYSNGDSPEGRWWKPAARRYAGLQLRANLHAFVKYRGYDSARETWFLEKALQSNGLPSALGSLLDGARSDGVPPESAHDVANPALGFATPHITELLAFALETHDIGVGDLCFRWHERLGRWRLETYDHERSNHFMPRLQVGTARLKCPAHAQIYGEGIDPKQTALTRLVHASINLGTEQHDIL